LDYFIRVKLETNTFRVSDELLLAEGFNPKFFTHFWRNSKGDAYLFCYEYGYMKITENNKIKYSLVIWQPYMR